jgi:hypothetical protein
VRGREVFAPASIVDENIRPRSTSEMTLGYAQHLGNTFYLSTSYMRRELEDDIVIGQCATATTCIGNPARGVLRTIQSRNGESIEVPRPRRESDVLRVQLEHHSDANPFQLSYVNGRHRGNTEPRLFPQTLFTTSPYTDFRQALGDFQRVTTDGPLHADRTHSVLLTGSTRWHPVRLNYVAYWKSGAPISRYGFSEVFGNYPYVLATRGSEGRTPSLYDVSLSAEYYTEIGPFEVRLTGSVENALNTQRPVLVDERWSFREQDNGGARPTNPSFGMPIFRTPPRSVTFGVRLTSARR